MDIPSKEYKKRDRLWNAMFIAAFVKKSEKFKFFENSIDEQRQCYNEPSRLADITLEMAEENGQVEAISAIRKEQKRIFDLNFR